MEDDHGKVWSQVTLFFVITSPNRWANGGCEPEPFYTSSRLGQEKLEELGGGDPTCRVRIQPRQALHDAKESIHGGLRIRAPHRTRSSSTTTT